LRLIEAHAILHQCTRHRDDEGCIVATTADYQAVRALVADLVAAGVGATVPETMRATVQAVQQHDFDEGATVREVADELKLDRSTTQRRIQAARERGYLVNREEKRGRPARYTIGDPLPEEQELLPLTVPEQGCAHITGEVPSPLDSISAEVSKRFEGGVQVCSDRGEMYTGATSETDESIPLLEED
ncbi:MAG TPA: winged helix-turn-helix transcriptional regulator, partial [Nitrospira sp.]|nr:winged helix-turn-helix transcriptional regulator [Nitrospira sp.]